ncbi:hypothetical protein [Variovorax sp. LG9.2]|uniref:hypothetical protein n=1 Tax=Variovorax sp. LG9.2 TaxID=3048626 RepID=UPI002B235827|nr:hypothetical protein [Variovorax sp. LG9.2]MEB0056470.1 hypothetical protein [Variovorax sp. LG9.2]
MTFSDDDILFQIGDDMHARHSSALAGPTMTVHDGTHHPMRSLMLHFDDPEHAHCEGIHKWMLGVYMGEHGIAPKQLRAAWLDQSAAYLYWTALTADDSRIARPDDVASADAALRAIADGCVVPDDEPYYRVRPALMQHATAAADAVPA